jgi:murein DD-endopeptidase MepM/ murein hydrolase activator NlpD
VRELKIPKDRIPKKVGNRSILFSVLFFSAGLLLLQNLHIQSNPPFNISDYQPQKLITSIEPYKKICTYIVKPGDTFAEILLTFGIPHNDIHACYKSLTLAGLSTIHPGDSMIVAVNDTLGMERFDILCQLKHWYHVKRESNTLCALRSPVSSRQQRCIFKGELRSCLSEDMAKAGVGDALVAKVTDIFAWDINFFIDPRVGDRIEVLFEKKFCEGRFTGYGDILAARYTANGCVYSAIGMRDSSGMILYYDKDGKSIEKQFLKAPLRFSRISSGYSFYRKHPILGITRPHLGVDYAAPPGTPVYAAADGTIIFCGNEGDFGKLVRISHGAAVETWYGHLACIAKGVYRGRKVQQGEYIGSVGSSGLSTGPHLDYRMKSSGRFINPASINPSPRMAVDSLKSDLFEIVKYECFEAFESRFAHNGCYVLDIVPSGVYLSDTLHRAASEI